MTVPLSALREAVAALQPTKAPFPPWPDDETLARMVREGGEKAAREIVEACQTRERLIEEARSDPFVHGFEWACWQRTDEDLPVRPWERDRKGHVLETWSPYRLLIVLGGNRASKSEWAIKRSIQTLVAFPETRIVFLCQKLETSRQIQQSYAWRYMPRKLRQLNHRRDPNGIYYIKHTKGTGFSENKFVLPNGSEGVFLVYTQDPSDYEGIQVGCPSQPGVIGWYADESMPLPWLTLMRTRSVTFDAVGLWTFTALNGMTQGLKQCMSPTRKTLLSEKEPEFEGRQNVPHLPKSHMPLIEEGSSPNIIIHYFHTRENPVGGYERLATTLRNKPWYMKERALCGYVRDVRGRLLTTFGPWNVVKPDQLPRDGLRFMHVDPHPRRHWFMLWVIVDDDDRIWVTDEWPPEEEFGEWALPTQRDPDNSGGKGWDGDPGPAQEPATGWGIAQYKKEMLRREGGTVIERRTVDRRAGPAPIPVGSGPSTCLWQELNAEQTSPDGTVLAPELVFELAGGPTLEEDGLELIKGALYVDVDKPIDPLENYPKLFVSASCKQLIWALENYTGRDGLQGACKDPIDCLRDMMTSGLYGRSAGRLVSAGGGFSY